MKNITDYIEYYGNTCFNEFPYNEVDALILAMLSYEKLEGIVPSGIHEYIYLEEACYHFLNKYKNVNYKQEDWLFPNSYHLMELLKTAKRYYHTKIYHYTSTVDTHGQFGAITLRLPNRVTYISIEGTDSNVVGWKEDFEIIYKYPIYSQLLAVGYLDETLNFFDRTIYVGGHSKGGNLAMYGYMYTKKRYKKRIKQVYNFDGPGFIDEIIKSKEYLEMLPKLTMLVPNDSVVGMILGHQNYRIINSRSKGIMQHDAYSWECDGDHFVDGVHSKKSIRLEQNLQAYIDEMSDEEKKDFVESIFAIFNKSNITNMMQVKELKISGIITMLKDFKNTSAQTKSDLIAVIKMLLTGMN